MPIIAGVAVDGRSLFGLSVRRRPAADDDDSARGHLDDAEPDDPDEGFHIDDHDLIAGRSRRNDLCDDGRADPRRRAE